MSDLRVFTDEISCRTFMDEQERTNTGWHTPILLDTPTCCFADGFVKAPTWQNALKKWGKAFQNCEVADWIPFMKEFYKAHPIGQPGGKTLESVGLISFIIGQVADTVDEWYIKISKG